jgi:hypothetical protein
MPEMHQFCEENSIQVLHLTVDKMKEDNIPLTYNKTLMALQVRLNHHTVCSPLRGKIIRNFCSL